MQKVPILTLDVNEDFKGNRDKHENMIEKVKHTKEYYFICFQMTLLIIKSSVRECELKSACPANEFWELSLKVAKFDKHCFRALLIHCHKIPIAIMPLKSSAAN